MDVDEPVKKVLPSRSNRGNRYAHVMKNRGEIEKLFDSDSEDDDEFEDEGACFARPQAHRSYGHPLVLPPYTHFLT